MSGRLALNRHILALGAEAVARLLLYMEAPEAVLRDPWALRHPAFLHRDSTARVKSLVMLHIKARPFELASVTELK